MKQLQELPKLKSSLGYVIRVLEEHHRQNRIAFGSDYDMRWDGYLIRYSDGKLVSPNVLTQHFKLFIQKHDFKAIRFHDLRHSCASILFANNLYNFFCYVYDFSKQEINLDFNDDIINQTYIGERKNG